MEKFTNPWETRKQELTQLVETYRNNAPLETFYEKIVSDYKKATSGMLDSKEERSEAIQRYSEMKKRNVLFVETLPEFRYVLTLLKKDGVPVNSVVAHENAHGNVTDIVGNTHTGYSIEFIKNLDGDIDYSFESHQTSNAATTEEALDREEKIMRAPEDYGDKMSESDKTNLARIQEIKKLFES